MVKWQLWNMSVEQDINHNTWQVLINCTTTAVSCFFFQITKCFGCVRYPGEIDGGAAAALHTKLSKRIEQRQVLTLAYLKKQHRKWPNFCKVVKMALLSSGSNAQPERVFSKLNWTVRGRRGNLKAENIRSTHFDLRDESFLQFVRQPKTYQNSNI